MNRQGDSGHEGRRAGKRAVVVEPPGSISIAAVAAHPDDIESWCAGTLAQAVDAGATVRLLLVTSGDKGSDERAATSEDVMATRERETIAAARLLGFAEVAFLRHPDGEVEDTRALRGQLVSCIRRWRPAAVFTHDPVHSFPAYLCHRDHRVVGRAVLDAVYPLARDRRSFPEHISEGLELHAVDDVWLFASAAAEVLVDISAGFARKVEARLAHQS